MSMDKIMEDRKEVVEKIAADIEAGKPLFWESGLTVSGRPRNIMQRSGRPSYYRGGNNLRLSFVAMQHGYTDPRWGTFKQVQEMGGRIKKGEKGTHIEYYQFEREVWEKNPKTGKKEPVYEVNADGCMAVKKERLPQPIIKSYVVFNAEQMEGIPPLQKAAREPEELNEKMEHMIANSEAKIHFDQAGQNFYQPMTDEIHVTPKEGFKTTDAFYATVAHEIAHSTGHKSRLARQTLIEEPGFDKKTYAREELRAELASLFIHQEYGLHFDEGHRKNHTAYLQSWAKVLRDDPNELFRAARDAERAADYIKEHMIEKVRVVSKERSAEIVAEWKARHTAPVKATEKESEQEQASMEKKAAVSHKGKSVAAKKEETVEKTAASAELQPEKKATVPRKRKVARTPKKEQGKARSMGR